MIDFISPHTHQKLLMNGQYLVSENGEKFPLVNGIPRFVEADNYANAFGHQWKSFPKIQLDSFNGASISKDRLERCLGYNVENLKGKTLLEAGCGAGRFTEHLVNAGALVHSIDLSAAVEVNKQNIGDKTNYRVAQASIYELPFAKESFDVVICLGVIQHTPSPEKTIESLWKMVLPGGQLVIDHYTFEWMYFLKPVLCYRFFLKRMKPAHSKKTVDRLVNFFFPLHWKYKNNLLIRLILNRISPVYIYFSQFPSMSRKFHFELSRLDTYDGLTDYYKHLRTAKQIENILRKLGAKNIEVWKGGNGVEGRCEK